MPITTSVSVSYAVKMIAIAVLCLVFGVWGIYDYAYAIPDKQRLFEQFQVLSLCKTGLESINPTPGHLTKEAEAATKALEEEWRINTGKLPRDSTTQENKAALEGVHGPWLQELFIISLGLLAERTPPLDSAAEDTSRKALEIVDARLSQMGTPSPPSPLDRATQWFFIASLPFAPYFFWLYLKAKRQVYRLDEQGTLHFTGDPQHGAGAWTQEEIAGIDMSRWMAKSIAWAVHQDGRRLKLDAYLHKDLHLIIGAIAARLNPNEWDAQAKPVKALTEAGPGSQMDEVAAAAVPTTGEGAEV